MPTYDYMCSSCQKKQEMMQKITEEPLKVCPECGKEALLRVFSQNVSLQFKGSGFYITDYCSKGDCSCSMPPKDKS